MAHRVVNFDGGVVISDSAATPSAIVERDANGNIINNGSGTGALPTGVTATSPYFANGGAQWQTPDAQTGTVSLTNASKRLQKLDGTASAYNVTLPPAATSQNQEFDFILINATHTVTLKGNGSENITVGASTANTYALSTLGAHVHLWCDGTQWWALY